MIWERNFNSDFKIIVTVCLLFVVLVTSGVIIGSALKSNLLLQHYVYYLILLDSGSDIHRLVCCPNTIINQTFPSTVQSANPKSPRLLSRLIRTDSGAFLSTVF